MLFKKNKFWIAFFGVFPVKSNIFVIGSLENTFWTGINKRDITTVMV